jgi:hypothetical protein
MPLCPDVIETQLAPLNAVQAQPYCVVTVKLPLPPAAGILRLVG